MKAVWLAAALALSLALGAAPAAAQDQWSDAWLGGQSTDSLRGLLEYLRTQQRQAAASPIYTDPLYRRMHAEWLAQTVERLRQVLLQRGVRVPAVVIAAPAAPGVPSEPAASGARPLVTPAAVPLLAVLTAAELELCRQQGIGTVDCAAALAARTAVNVALGAVVAVVAPGGSVVLSAVAVAASTASLVVSTVAIGDALIGQAGAIVTEVEAARELGRQQAANAGRMTPALVEQLVASYVRRLEAARVDPATAHEAAEAVSRLDREVEAARTSFGAFRTANEAVRAARTACAAPARQPLALAARADERLNEMMRQAAAIETALAAAARDVAACADATMVERARAAHGQARADVEAVERLGEAGRADAREALEFFGLVRTARANAGTAAGLVAALERHRLEAERLEKPVRDAVLAYRRRLEARANALAGVYASLQALRSAFPAPPPAHIDAALRRLDDAYTREASRGLTADRLSAMDEGARDQVSRAAGFHRQALEERADLGACGTVTGEVPQTLQADLTRISTGMADAVQRATRALEGAAAIPARAEACLARGGAAGSPGRLTGSCTGVIDVTPLTGRPGSPLTVRVAIDPPADLSITRVVVDNPGCTTAACREMRQVRNGVFTLGLQYRAPAGAQPAGGVLGTFQLQVTAYSDNQMTCSGRSPGLKVLAP